MELDRVQSLAQPREVGAHAAAGVSDRLVALEREHRELSAKRRRLHESIDLLTKQDVLKPDIAALLARYRRSERDISWRRRELHRALEQLRGEANGGAPGAAS